MFIDFEPWHLTKMRLSDEIRDILGKLPTGKRVGQLAARGLAFTSVAKGPNGTEILGVVGATPREDGKTAEVFLIASKDGRRLMWELAKDVRRVLAVAREQFATIEALGDGSPRINRWLSWLGFERREALPENKSMWRLA